MSLKEPIVSIISEVVPVSLLGGNTSLVRFIQGSLSAHGYLDPPSDGLFGQVSLWALREFCDHHGKSLGAGFTPEIAELLNAPIVHLREFDLSSHWFGRAIKHAQDQGHWFCRHPACWNILYVEGINVDGSRNSDEPNRFNDVRGLFKVTSTGALDVLLWEGTTEPGTHWTLNPMNPDGAARIKFDQYKAWRVGVHNSNHEALVQVEPVSVHRDLNQDYMRTGDELDTGLFGINQHWGYDLPRDNLGNSSAGCLVGRTKSGHKDFMAKLKADGRYQANPGYKFMTSIVSGDTI